MFKRIVGFENYAVNENGIVINTTTNHIKKPSANNMGYLYVDLYNHGTHRKEYIHRLVAKAFIANTKNKPYINHIDGNPCNNSVSNLEWCTPLENVDHASKVIKTMQQYKKANEKKKKKVCAMDRFTGWRVAEFTSIRQASFWTGIPTSNIVACLKGRQRYTRDYTWQYVEALSVDTH